MPASPKPPPHGPAVPAGPWGRVAPLLSRTSTELHPRLADVLLRVRAAERTASGPDRRPTFRLMRELLGAAIALGVPARALAECLDTSPASVIARARSSAEVAIPGELVQRLSDLTPAQLSSLSAYPLTALAVVPGLPGADGGEHYSTVAFVRTVLALPRPPADPA